MVLINTNDKKVSFYDSNIKLKTNKETKDLIKAFIIYILNKDSTEKSLFLICVIGFSELNHRSRSNLIQMIVVLMYATTLNTSV